VYLYCIDGINQWVTELTIPYWFQNSSDEQRRCLNVIFSRPIAPSECLRTKFQRGDGKKSSIDCNTHA
jgi:hypothetical protein